MPKIVKLIFVFFLFFALSGYVRAEVQKLNIIPRAQWGADEVIRYNKDGKESWPEEYAGINKIIIHHTAGTNGKDNPQASVRAIYNYHADGRGWGDIGYNYLIDPMGNIYEGRFGGDGVIGAHAYDDSRNIGWNSGTIGISILGTYGGWVNETKQGYYLEHPEYYPPGRVKNERLSGKQWQIYLEDALSPQIEESLTSLIAVKSLDFGFLPDGASIIQGKNLPNVIGHRDVDYTTCPGDEIYNQLPLIRQKAQKKYETIIAQGIKQKATLVGPNDIKLSLKKDEAKEIILQFKNEGDLTWHNYTDDKLILADSGVKNKLAMLDGVGMAVNTNQRESGIGSTLTADASYQLTEHNVKPGEIGTFKIVLKYPENKLIDEKKLVLAIENKGWFTGTDVNIAASAIDLSYKGELLSHDTPIALMENSTKDVSVKIKNTGIKAWYKDKKSDAVGTNVYLKISDKINDGESIFNSLWENKYGLLKPEEAEIMPGNFGTFKFKIKTSVPGFYRMEFTLMRAAPELNDKKELEVNGAVFDTLTRVDSPYQAELIEANVPQAMLNIWSSKAAIKIKNTGSVTWDKNFVLKIFTVDGKESPFKEKSWEKSGVVTRLPAKVVPGQMAIMSAKIKAPKTPGIYNLAFVLEYKGHPVYVSYQKDLIYTIRVDAAK